jgi:hypothetical protein
MTAARGILVASAVALVAAAGCGGDDDGGSDKPATAGTDTGTVAADSCKLLTNQEIEAQIGPGFAPDEKTGRTLDNFSLSQCVWEAGEGKVGLAVVGSPERYRMHEQRGTGEAVEGLGDAALVETGTSLEDRGGTGGRTAFVLDADRTLVVVLDKGRQEQVSVEEVVELARAAHGRLP